MGDIHVVFFEGTLIQEYVDALARRQLALCVLRLDALDAATEPSLFPPRFQLLQNAGHVSSMRYATINNPENTLPEALIVRVCVP